jgi:hypothetical protein
MNDGFGSFDPTFGPSNVYRNPALLLLSPPRLDRGRPYWRAGRECASFLTWGNTAAVSCLLNKLSTHRITGELVDSKIRINAAYSAEQRSAVRWIGENTPSQWSDAESLTVVLLLSLCPALA